MFVLGKGYGEPIAMEGALKIKEMTYMHAEGYSGGALKHGPFALIEGKVCKIDLLLLSSYLSFCLPLFSFFLTFFLSFFLSFFLLSSMFALTHSFTFTNSLTNPLTLSL